MYGAEKIARLKETLCFCSGVRLVARKDNFLFATYTNAPLRNNPNRIYSMEMMELKGLTSSGWARLVMTQLPRAVS